MSSRSLGRIAALSATVALGAAACAPHQPTPLPVPIGQTAVVPAPAPPTVTAVPLGTPNTTVAPLGPGLVPSLSAPPAPRGVAGTAPVLSASPQVVVPSSTSVAYPPVYSPPTAQPRGIAPSDPAQYVTTSPLTVSGRVVAISQATGSFLLQTPTEGWTVVLPAGATAPSVATGRTLTVTAYVHRTERNQLLATSISP